MKTQKTKKLPWLAKHLPEGMPVDSKWLREHGFSANLLRKYEISGWLQQPAHRIYVRPRGRILWQPSVISLQTLLARDLIIGGRTALELQGFAHYLQQTTRVVYLYGPKPPPTWLKDLPAGVEFRYRNDGRLFNIERASTFPHSLEPPSNEPNDTPAGILTKAWGPWDWPLMMSSPERAFLELLDEIPNHESFHQLDMVMEGLTTLSPSKLRRLLYDCHNVKVKRLFFFFADRHHHAWRKHLDVKAVDLGSGKRVLAKGGRYDAKYLITVPRDFDGVQ